LNAMSTIGHQVLNIEALMVRRRGSISFCAAPQPSQAWFESQLLQRLRSVDPRRPVWIGDVEAQVGELQLPGSMADAIVAAPAAPLEAPIEERVIRWIEDEPAWASPSDAVDAIVSWSPPPDGRLIERWRELSLRELAGLVASVLTDYLDRRQAARLSLRMAKSNGIKPLVVDSLRQDQLALAVRAWQPTPEAAAT
jgi:tRNA 2-selenouridine synthase